MKRTLATTAWLLALALVASSVRAANPDTPGRASGAAETSGATTICEGGSNPGAVCPFGSGCNDGGTCTGVGSVRIAARGVLTVISDTKPFGVGWTSTTMAGCHNPPTDFEVGDCETPENATFTLLLEFTLNAKKYTWAETFLRLPGNFDPNDPNHFNSGQVENWVAPGDPQGDFAPGWNQQVVESSLAERSMSGNPVLLRWGVLPPAAEAAVGAVLGRTATQRVALSRTDSVPICTDTTPCNLSATNPNFSDHSNGTDPLATVRRWKVDIAVIGP